MAAPHKIALFAAKARRSKRAGALRRLKELGAQTQAARDSITAEDWLAWRIEGRR
jgi:hypothetical protein